MGTTVNGIYLPGHLEQNWDDEVNENFKRLGELAINVKTVATGDGTTNDRAAIQTSIASNRTLLFPGGTYAIGGNSEQGLLFDGLNNVTLLFAGGALKKQSSASPDQQRLMTFSNCTNVRIIGGSFDFNNIERYGGINFTGCNRVWVQNCRFFDSNLNASWSTYDHYALVVQTSTDVWVTDNVSSDIELIEANNNRRLYVQRNTSIGAAGTTAIGWFATADGTYAYDYFIEDNTILDTRKHAILFRKETGSANNILKGIHIRGNNILHDATAGTGYSISIYDVSVGTATGNIYHSINIEDNYIRDTASRGGVFEIYMNERQTGDVFLHSKVSGNKVDANTTTEYVVRLDKQYALDLSHNQVYGTFANGIAANGVNRSMVAFNHVDGASGTPYLYQNAGTANNVKQSNRTDGTWNDLGGTAF